jgi:hypothetical protein
MISPVWLAFGCGAFLGTLVGVLVMCFIFIARSDDEVV